MSLLDYSPLYKSLHGSALEGWVADLRRLIEANIENSTDGHMDDWLGALASLPAFKCQSYDLTEGVRFEGSAVDIDLRQLLKRFHPWRKGPLKIGNVEIDTEWRSDWKWDRLKNEISNLEGRRVLDVGCGNGYYLWRMVGKGAELALGIDPYMLYVMQFWATKHFAPGELPAWVLPMGWEELPDMLPHFDTVFAMGVLYHRKKHGWFLQQLQNYLRPGGELVLETLVTQGNEDDILVPDGRYAKMRNVHFIPSAAALETALKEFGWQNVRCVDVTPTTIKEQRSTDWMTFESLSDFLDPLDPRFTVEGYPAPQRAIFLANSVVRYAG